MTPPTAGAAGFPCRWFSRRPENQPGPGSDVDRANDVSGTRRASDVRPLWLDGALYLGCAVYALVLALTDKHLGFRVWGVFATAAYTLALLHTALSAVTLRARTGPGSARASLGPAVWSRWVGVGLVSLVGMLAPLVTLVIRRGTAGGDWAGDPGMWNAQPEVWVIERSAERLVETGSPYADIAALGDPGVYDYAPYGPVMALLGLPRALAGTDPVAGAVTDARLVFALVAVVAVAATLRSLGGPRVPVRAAQLAAVFPLTALTWATAGPDLAVLGLIVLGCALAATDHPAGAAVALGVAAGAKLIALPAAVVAAVLVAARTGARTSARFAGVWLAVTATLTVPILVTDPRAFIENVVRFPAGLAAVSSPAASPLPGHLLASAGPTGTVLAFALLGTAALAVTGWLLYRPPRTGADALLRIAVGLGAFTMLTPATRFGYLVYVSVLLGMMWVFQGRATAAPSGAAEPGSGTTPGHAPLTSS